jgi:MoaA/NifB/PqqE/SkfB family radical SAM enzyme
MNTKVLKVCFPNVLVTPVIDFCEGRCQMCGIWKHPLRPPMSPSLLTEILSQNGFGEHLRYINMTGGEPVNHPEFGQLATVFSETCPALREVSINISGLDPDLTEQQVPVFREKLDPGIALQFTISLDGVGELHDRIRGSKGAFERTKDSIRRCKQLIHDGLDIDLRLNCTISRNNSQGMSGVIGFARAENIPVAVTYAATNGLYLRNQGRTAVFEMDHVHRDQFRADLIQLRYDSSFPRTDRHYFSMIQTMMDGNPRPCGCVFQTRGVFLDLDGQLYPCGTAPDLAYGKLPEESFQEIYFGSRGDEIRSELLSRYCGKCPTNSYHGLADDVWLDVLREGRRNP